MLVDTLNSYIIEMKAVKEMETASNDSKKQADADYSFKQVVSNLKRIINKVDLAVKNSEFKPSANTLAGLKSFVAVCDKVVEGGTAVSSTNFYLSKEIKELYSELGQEWSQYYLNATSNVLSLLDVVKNIVSDERKVQFASSKIRKAENWNTSAENYNSLKQGLHDARQIFSEIGLDENSSIMMFLKNVSNGSATISDLTDEIIVWIKDSNLGQRMFIRF